MFYDIAFSCQERIGEVSGGIGTYTRELALQLSKAGVCVVLFVPAKNVQDARAVVGTAVTVVPVNDPEEWPNNLRSDALRWSYQLYIAIKSFLYSNVIGVFEFPDYMAEGYYSISAAVFGVVDLNTCVRLHSPLFMLKDDNESRVFYVEDNRVISAEMACILLTDEIAYGADAMRDRVLSYFEPHEAERIKQKCVKIQHPVPRIAHTAGPETRQGASRKIADAPPCQFQAAVIGRLEFRKGQDLVIRALAHLPPEICLQLEFFGGDTNTAPNGSSYKEYLLGLAVDIGVEKSIKLHGRMSQEQLAQALDHVELFIFPSRFENFPNALLEIVDRESYIIVSDAGGMPEILSGIGAGFSTANPNQHALARAIEGAYWRRAERFTLHSDDIIEKYSGEMVRGYVKLIEKWQSSSRSNERKSDAKLTIVIPHFNQSNLITELFVAISNLRTSAPWIKVHPVIYDDGSDDEHVSMLRNLCERNDVKLVMPIHRCQGPAVLRQRGLEEAKTEFIFFCDADDNFEIDFITRSICALQEHEHIDFCVAPHSAFGAESYTWMPSPANPGTVIFENFTNSALLCRRSSLNTQTDFNAFTHSEDWYTAGVMVLRGLRHAAYPEIGYNYRRGHRSRSSSIASLRESTEIIVRRRLLEILRESQSREAVNVVRGLLERGVFEAAGASGGHGMHEVVVWFYQKVARVARAFRIRGLVIAILLNARASLRAVRYFAR